MRFILLYALVGVLISFRAYADVTVFTYRSPESAADARYNYDNALLKLALDKTVDEYGPYELRPSPAMNFSRALHTLESGELPNFVMKNSFNKHDAARLDYIPVPLDRGIVGYRVFFVPDEKKQQIADIMTMDELKKLKVVQGRGWFDVDILEAAGFDVDVLANYESLFQYIAAGRADLFPRGANELLSEYESYKSIEGLAYDEALVLYYPLPRFFFVSKFNTEARNRITLGLEKAWEDGSFKALWESKYRKNIDFLKLRDRRIFTIENEDAKILGEGYKKYIYDPFHKISEPDKE